MHLATHWNTCEKLPLLVNFMGRNLLCQNIPALIFQFFGFQNAYTFPKKNSWFCSPTSIHIIIKTNLFLRHCIFLHASYPRSSLIAYLVQLQRTVFVSFIVYFLYTNWIYLVHRCIYCIYCIFTNLKCVPSALIAWIYNKTQNKLFIFAMWMSLGRMR